jgi:hypothetical protein
LNAAWKIPQKKSMSFKSFRLKLSGQMLAYDPRDALYPADDKTRAFSQQNEQTRNKRRRSVGDYPGYGDFQYTNRAHRANGTTQKKDVEARLCGDLDRLQEHIDSKEKFDNGNLCAVYNVKATYKCGKCKVALHFLTGRNTQTTAFVSLNNITTIRGLCQKYFPLVGKSHRDWVQPTGIEQLATNSKKHMAEQREKWELEKARRRR